MDENVHIDKELLKETKEFYEDVVKPTVRKNYIKNNL